MKKVISTILALSLIISTPLSIFGNSIENIPPNNLESKTEVLNIDGENIKYTTSENKNSRIIKLSNFKKTEQHVVFYDKENSRLYLDSKEIEYTMTENNSKLINEKHINKKSKWRYLTTKKFKFNFKKEIAKSVLIGMIAALAGGPVGAFWEAVSAMHGIHSNCSGIVKWYNRRIGHKIQKKASAVFIGVEIGMNISTVQHGTPYLNSSNIRNEVSK